MQCEYDDPSNEKITVFKKLKELDFFKINQQELINRINSLNSLNIDNGELVFSSCYNCFGDGYGYGFIQVSVKRLETDDEFQWRLKENARKLAQKEKEDREKYERLKRKFDCKENNEVNSNGITKTMETLVSVTAL